MDTQQLIDEFLRNGGSIRKLPEKRVTQEERQIPKKNIKKYIDTE